MADDTTRGVHLNEKQLVFVLMAAGVICGVMFLFGVLVGRGVQAERGPVADGAMIGATQVVPDPQLAGDAAGSKPGAAPPDDYTYAKRLQQPEAPAEPLTALTSAGASAPAAPGAGAAASDVPMPPPDAPDESPAAGRADAATAGPFTVQVVVVNRRGDADRIVRELKNRGYDARVVAPSAGEKTAAFKIRVGTYRTRRDADTVARRIESEGKYKPWVTR